MEDITEEAKVTLDTYFTYHKPEEEDHEKYESIRAKGKALAAQIEACCPYSREKSTAIAKTREAVMWANSAIACNPKTPKN